MTVEHERQVLRQARMDREEHDYAQHTRNAKLAALVTPELPALLEHLAEGIDCLAPAEAGIPTRTDEARELATHIREVLEEQGK